MARTRSVRRARGSFRQWTTGDRTGAAHDVAGWDAATLAAVHGGSLRSAGSVTHSVSGVAAPGFVLAPGWDSDDNHGKHRKDGADSGDGDGGDGQGRSRGHGRTTGRHRRGGRR